MAGTGRDQRSGEAEAYRRLYKTARWQRIRNAQLQAYPLCQECIKRKVLTPATVCNHVDKASKATNFFAGPFNSLCAPCHDAGQQKAEVAGFSGECDADGWPTDQNHPANRR